MPRPKRPASRFLPRGVRILFEDRDVLVIDKPPGLLTIATDREEERTAYAAMMSFVRKGQERAKARVFIVHRLDRDTSGVLLFARSEDVQQKLQGAWESTRKVYQAVVHGSIEGDEGIYEDLLVENRGYRVYVTHDREAGYLSRTGWRVLQRTPELTLLDLDLHTGRKHQLRVQLAHRGHPIVGDRVYGQKDRAVYRRLGLHARLLEFDHPRTGERVSIATDVPGPFQTWMSYAERRARAAGSTTEEPGSP